MEIKDWTIEDIPEYALSYLINSDMSGLSDEDQKAVLDYERAIDDWVDEQEGVSWEIELLEDEPHFTKAPAFGLPCMAFECKIVVLGK